MRIKKLYQFHAICCILCKNNVLFFYFMCDIYQADKMIRSDVLVRLGMHLDYNVYHFVNNCTAPS